MLLQIDKRFRFKYLLLHDGRYCCKFLSLSCTLIIEVGVSVGIFNLPIVYAIAPVRNATNAASMANFDIVALRFA